MPKKMLLLLGNRKLFFGIQIGPLIKLNYVSIFLIYLHLISNHCGQFCCFLVNSYRP